METICKNNVCMGPNYYNFSVNIPFISRENSMNISLLYAKKLSVKVVAFQ